ncbi:CYTH and CHAD domain-containing protein [Glaciimonas sp. PCH181]|uniref:CYTH and CHAD domain-containing protein n=1 Tax=Glaciimonas sp. PCH181 TaxID=2133943 RepID=UPI000D3C2D0C|nr:CYTH and CHAD domain-containing protein [Glaciimonas sp. PCH181]PUA16477.1 inorganic triphosphatase [Glaciimonas sp. PCH181]
MEIELKLLISPDAVSAFRRHPLLKKLAIAKPYKQQLISTYFDTPDCILMRHRAGLRVRQVGNKLIQTLKAGGQVDSGLHQRNEWESEVSALAPDLLALREMLKPKSAWDKLLSKPAMVAQLTPLFTTQFQRNVWLLRLPQGDEVELVLDEGQIQYGADANVVADMVTPISEIELELKSGEAANLFAFALELQKTIPLRLSNISKAERGYRLYRLQTDDITEVIPVEIARAAPLDILDKKTVAQGFQAIIANCVAQIQGNEAGLLSGTDPENVHQMRVGVRRLRSALAIFSDAIPFPPFLEEECEWLGQHLGAVRDWDVFAGTTLDAEALGSPDMPEFQMLRQEALKIAQNNRAKAIEVVNSDRYARLLLTLGACAHGVEINLTEDAPMPIKVGASLQHFASEQLAHYQKKLHKRGKGLRRIDAAQRHRLRIAAKKLRYALDFFESLYPPKKIAIFIAGLHSLQDALGALNDASVAGRLLQQCLHTRPELAEVCGYVRGYSAAGNKKTLGELNKLWKKFKQIAPPFEK